VNISYRHIVRYFYSEPSVKEISEKLFQLGHENEIEENDILNIEFTPNKGDCLSLKGIVRDLGIFYETKKNDEIFEDPISFFDFKFKNLSTSDCPKISFLKIEIEGDISDYKDNLRSYFDDLDIKKNNFFTDVSNYVAYETGQPTHCYDAKKIKNEVQLKKINSKTSFNTLINKEINLTNENLVFCIDDEVINLAGVMGGKSTSCSGSTTEVIVECAYFKPESIIGKSLKYDIQSDAAYKFERGVDPSCHEDVLRRFIFIVSEHAKLKSIKLFTESHQDIEEKKIQFDVDKIKKIIGIDIKEAEYKNMLLKLGFGFENQYILIPTYRSDIETQNDLAEEVSRIIGYDEIPREEFKISKSNTKLPTKRKEQNIKNFLIDNGFFEIINNPFTSIKSKGSIKIDNPLDSNRKFLRSNLKNSLVENLLYNERRQKDSIKLFEISDVYFNSNEIKKSRLLGIIASGRVGKNYRDFSRWINEDYLSDILDRFQIKDKNIQVISRENLESKSKNKIVYFEISVDDIIDSVDSYIPVTTPPSNFITYSPISEYPSSSRDLSFSINNPVKLNELRNTIEKYHDEDLKEKFIFDFYENPSNNEIKIGFRFIFQSQSRTLKEDDINIVIKDIIAKALAIETVTIPGL
tara:strand:+ start:6323 stop:8230 length:1908 start_codon:yes stop_codon:yes gene_type:complete